MVYDVDGIVKRHIRGRPIGDVPVKVVYDDCCESSLYTSLIRKFTEMGGNKNK
jgi:hypothetical protein